MAKTEIKKMKTDVLSKDKNGVPELAVTTYSVRRDTGTQPNNGNGKDADRQSSREIKDPFEDLYKTEEVIEPPHDPYDLCALIRKSNTLPQCIEARGQDVRTHAAGRYRRDPDAALDLRDPRRRGRDVGGDAEQLG